MKYADYEFSRLCELIDDLTQQLEDANARAREYQHMLADEQNRSIAHSGKMIAGMLQLCLEKPQIFDN